MKFPRHTLHISALTLSVLCAPGQGARAAPFCVRNQVIPAQCIYYDPQQCEQEARRQNAECSANPAELHLSQANGEYCVVTGSLAAVCAYADRQTCAVEAARQQGVCTQALPNQVARQPNPFSPVNGQ